MNSNTVRIMSLFASNPDRTYTAADVIAELNIAKGSAGTLLGDLAKAGRVARAGRGQYQHLPGAVMPVRGRQAKAKAKAIVEDTGIPAELAQVVDTDSEVPKAARKPKAQKHAPAQASLGTAPVKGNNTGLGDQVLGYLRAGKATSVDTIAAGIPSVTRKQILDSLRGLVNRKKAEKLTASSYTRGERA